jgi:hypothetical protein
VDDALQDYEGLANRPTFDDTPHESALTRTSNMEYYDNAQYINPSLLTTQGHESQPCFPSEISQLTKGVLTQDSQSQISPNFLPTSVQQPSPALSSFMPRFEQASTFQPSPPSIPSPANSATQSISLSGNSYVSDKTPDSKKQISPIRSSLVCNTCTETLSSSLRYRQHVGRRSCQAVVPRCQHCGKPFKQPKNLTRHLKSSCPVLKATSSQGEPFICTCAKTYPRKDSLQRHMDRANARENQQQHRCRACGCCRCTCQSGKPC